ncbi:acyl-CoA thioesterase [Indioceanicola profundi]|uniref:acyl-CoA thioesterase n=1 Tax=Indioceanicola profundi TaxID=2220096 RepID=UPI000E6A9FC4|nr:thioesterase family protein [Indioceanicola profundi]
MTFTGTSGPADTGAVQLTDPALYRHWSDEHVRFNDLDPLGHANNNAIGVYFESGRVAFHDAIGLRDNLDHQFVAARIVIEYKAEIHRPNRLRIGTGVLRIGRTSWTLGSALFIGDRCMATSECVLVLIDTQTRRPVPIPDLARGGLARHLLVPA